MNVKDLKAKQGSVTIELEILSVAEPRMFSTPRATGKVANAAAKDDKGDEIQLTLWNEQTTQVKAGDKIKIENGYVGEYKGQLQLSTGRQGILTVLESAGKSEE